MNEERMAILKMLEENTITVEEAKMLLQAIQDSAEGKQVSTTQEEPVLKQPALSQSTPFYSSQPASTQATRLFTLDEVISLNDNDIDPHYIKALSDAGLTDLAIEQIVQLHEHDIDPAQIRKAYQAGLSAYGVDDLIQLAEQDIAVEDLIRFRDAGIDLQTLAIEDIVALHEHDVDPAQIKKARQAGLPAYSADEFINFAENDVTVDYLVRLRDAGFNVALSTVDEIIALHERDVDPGQLKKAYQAGLPVYRVEDWISFAENDVAVDYLLRLRNAGLQLENFAVEDIITLSENDVNPSYIAKLYKAGATHLSIDQIVSLHENEIDPAYVGMLRR